MSYRADYKRLGDYITPCNEKNTGDEIELLQGISNQKYFQKAKTNTIGVDLSKYRIVRKGQFAFNRATTRNGDKISIALQLENDCIVSPSYRIFQSKDENVLNSEYLMMWFRRPEFDRYARFKSHGSAHEFFDYDEMCDVELPVPSIQKQRAIVQEYNTVVQRIELNEQLNQKLEETAQALYRHWFVDFEFPNENGQPYKSNGGKMVWNEELEKEIPEEWKVGTLRNLMIFKNGKKKPEAKGSFPIYGGNGVLGYSNEFNHQNVIAIGRVGAYCGSLFRELGECWISDNAIAGYSKMEKNHYCFYLLKNSNLNDRSEGTGQPLLTQGLLYEIRTILVTKQLIEKFDNTVSKLFQFTVIYSNESSVLQKLRETLLKGLAKNNVLGS